MAQHVQRSLTYELITHASSFAQIRWQQQNNGVVDGRYWYRIWVGTKIVGMRLLYNDTQIPPKDDERTGTDNHFFLSKRQGNGMEKSIRRLLMHKRRHNCPEYPPVGYHPVQWLVLEVTKQWPTDDATPRQNSTNAFVYSTIALNYARQTRGN